MQGNSKTSYYP